MITIDLNFFATLRSFLPDSPKNMEIPEGTCVKDLVAGFGIPETDVKLIFINGKTQLPSYELKHNDRVGIFPPVGGVTLMDGYAMDLKPRYARNFQSISLSEQALLADTRVCIVGLGGLGGGVVEVLARIGIGSLDLVDGDSFDETNLNRQLLSTEKGIGTSKVRAARERVAAINATVKVQAFDMFLNRKNADEIMGRCHVVVDCLDSIGDRFLLQDLARSRGIPLVSGAIAGTSGQVMVIYPEDPGFELIYGDSREYKEVGVEKQLGNLAHCALLVASLQCSEVIKVVLGRGEILRNRLLICDLMTNTFEVMQLV